MKNYINLTSTLILGITLSASNIAFAESDKELNVVKVVATNTSKAFKPGMLKDDLVKTEVINSETLQKSGFNNIVDAIRKNPGISDEVNCSVCGARGISLNQMPSQYTTVMIDGVPIYSSVSGVYGLDSIGINNIERVEVARGAGTSVIAPEALSGTVNIVTKKPVKDQFSTQLTYGSYNTKEFNLYSSKVVDGGAVSISAVDSSRDHIDEDNNLISEAPKYDRQNISAGFFIDDLLDFTIKGNISFATEERAGGASVSNISAIQDSNNGNPFNFANTKNGSNDSPAVAGYDEGLNGISEIIKTKRRQVVTTAEKDTNFGGLRFAFGLASHHQDSSYSNQIYIADQMQYYTEAAARFDINNNNELTFGYNYLYQDLDSNGIIDDGNGNRAQVDGVDNFRYVTNGIFTKLYNSSFDDKLETTLSVRGDYHNEFDAIFTPRANFLLHHNDSFDSRLSLGTGYRAPSSYFEYEHGLLSVNNIRRDIEEVEKSKNLSYSLNFQGDRLNTTVAYNYTNIENIAKIEIDDVNNVALFNNSENEVTIQNIDLNASYLLTPRSTISLGGELNFFDFETGDLPIARPKQRAFLGLDHKVNDNLNLYAQLNWTGKSDVEKFYGERFNLNGTKKSDESEAFTTLDLRSDIKLSKYVGLSLGVNNLFDYVQTNDDSQLFLTDPGAGGEIDVANIWGPVIGRYMYATLKIDL